MPRRAISGHPDYVYVYEWPDETEIPQPPMAISEFQPAAFVGPVPEPSVSWWKRWMWRFDR